MLLQRQCSIHLHDMRFSHVEEKRKNPHIIVFELLIGEENIGAIGRKTNIEIYTTYSILSIYYKTLLGVQFACP